MDQKHELQSHAQHKPPLQSIFSDPLAQMIIEGSQDCIKVLDVEGQLLYMNRGGQRTMEIEDFSQCHMSEWISFWTDGGREQAKEALAVAQSGQEVLFEGPCRTAKGTLKWWEVTITPFWDEQHVMHFLAISRDITDRHQLEQQRTRTLQTLSQEFNRLSEIFNTLPIGVLLVEAPGGTVLLSNHQMEVIVGHPLEPSVLYANFEQKDVRRLDGTLLPLQDRPLARALRGEHVDEIVTYHRANGTMVFLQQMSTPLRDDRGTVIAGMIAVTDITEQREMEHQKEAFLGLASHELKAPLTALQGMLQLAQLRLHRVATQEDLTLSEKQSIIENVQGFIARCQQHIRLQNRLIDDLLDMSRLQQDQLVLHFAPCDVSKLVEEMVLDQQTANPQRTILFEKLERTSVVTLADSDRLGQVLNNYLNNALKYAPAEQPVTINITTDENKVCVRVKDHGPGLAKVEQERIWQRFYQVPTIDILSPVAGSRGVGLGLGLYICQKIIHGHGGQVGIESQPGHGSTFWFTLPIVTTVP